MTPGFWRGKRVFLTGHTGFKGSWLSLWLQDLGVTLTGYSLAPATSPSLYAIAHVGDGMHSLRGDIRDLQSLQKAMQDAEPEIVIHLAAQALVRDSYVHPVETYAVNVMGTVNLLEAVRRTSSVKAVINVTTDKCYENREWLWGYRENEAIGGHDPYSSSKGCAELISAAYRSSFFSPDVGSQATVALATARAGNVIGGGDWAKDRLIPDMLAAFESGQPALIRNPNATRPWQHVLEPLRGYLCLAEHLYEHGQLFAEGWNFGPNDTDARSVSWIADQLCHQFAGSASWQADKGLHPHEANYLKLDISKAKARLNWQPLLHLESALDLVVLWSHRRLAGHDVRATTLKQIQSYQQIPC